jgi:transcriptional regulator with XRE-family HTH domain
MWDRWPYQRIGMRTYMRSTYDRAGGNEMADASHFLYQLADDRNVTLDIEGTGVLTFVRFNHWHGSPWHFEIDGTDNVVQETSTVDPLHPKPNSIFLPEHAFRKPLAYTWSDTKGADLSWIPMGFQKSLRLSYERTFYGTGYYIVQQFLDGISLSQPISSWNTQSLPPRDVLDLIARAGTDIAPPPGSPGIIEVSGKTALAARQESLVWDHSGKAMIRLLAFSVPRSSASAFSDARLVISWDDRSLPSVVAPLALFFGAGTLYNRENKEFLVKSFPMVVRFDEERIHLSCYFPMPFFHRAKISLVGAENLVADVEWKIRCESFASDPASVGYFHATYTDQDYAGRGSSGAKGNDMVLLNTQMTEGGGDWSGSFVGTSIVFSDNGVLSTLEGDPRFFFDDSETPQAQGTGTEEWAGGGDYWGGETMTLPFAGHPAGARSRRDAVSPEDKIESAYRFLLADLMPFGRNALIQLERGGENDSAEHYQTIAYWYDIPEPSLIKTDVLSIGDQASEAQHNYLSPDASAPYEITSRYEWGPDTRWGIELFPRSTDMGRTTTTFSEFELRIDPGNIGVMFRRKLDYAYPNQRARVLVRDPKEDGWKYAGIWYLSGSNTCVFSTGGVHSLADFANKREIGATEHIVQTSNRRFRDDEFLISAALTRGRAAIRVRIEFLPVQRPLFPGHPMSELAWSEIRYTAYSFVMPIFSPA